MAIGIIGLPQSGKTTIFNAVTRGHAETARFSAGGTQPNIGVAKVPDARLQVLSDMHKSKRIVPAEIEYVDIPGVPEGLGQTKGISGEFLNLLQRSDALLLVARSFDDPSVPHVEGSVDAYRDVTTLDLEMTFSDLGILERREQRIKDSFKGAKPQERGALEKELEVVQSIRAGLEAEVPVRQQTLPADAGPIVANFQLLTAKPLIIVFNVGEDDLARRAEIEAEMREKLGRPQVEVGALCGSLEMELAQMSPDDETEFRASLEAGESGLETMVRLSYSVLGLISFLTTGEDETRAWTIVNGTQAQLAAGKVHSDIQRGFIRAEVVAYGDLTSAGGLAEARKQGVLRAEGKTYVVKDGDVINYLFNV